MYRDPQSSERGGQEYSRQSGELSLPETMRRIDLGKAMSRLADAHRAADPYHEINVGAAIIRADQQHVQSQNVYNTPVVSADYPVAAEKNVPQHTIAAPITAYAENPSLMPIEAVDTREEVLNASAEDIRERSAEIASQNEFDDWAVQQLSAQTVSPEDEARRLVESAYSHLDINASQQNQEPSIW